MYHVYCENLKTGVINFCGMYETAEEAIRKMMLCYSIDKDLKQLGDNYYFMKRH